MQKAANSVSVVSCQMSVVHKSVLLQEVVEGLAAKKGDIVLDGTVGGGGHSEAICNASKGEVTVVCLDADEDAIARSRERLKDSPCRFKFMRSNFRSLDTALSALGIGRVDRILLDLGLSSFQLAEDSGRGFSFKGSDPLTMTFAKAPSQDELTAYAIVNEWEEESIATIIGSYGEERAAKRIAAAIVREREHAPIRTTAALRDIIERALPRRGKLHPATKTFQALRIAVNDEMRALSEGLEKGWRVLSQGGRFAVISFHSHEDRVVKRFFRSQAQNGEGELITKKPIVPSKAEVALNPRSRSAKLRIIEKK